MLYDIDLHIDAHDISIAFLILNVYQIYNIYNLQCHKKTSYFNRTEFTPDVGVSLYGEIMKFDPKVSARLIAKLAEFIARTSKTMLEMEEEPYG